MDVNVNAIRSRPSVEVLRTASTSDVAVVPARRTASAAHPVASVSRYTYDWMSGTGAAAWEWGSPAPFRAIVTQTADPVFSSLDPSWFPDLELAFDGRASLRELALPAGVTYRGIGLPARPG